MKLPFAATRPSRGRALAAAFAVGLALAGCGSDEDAQFEVADDVEAVGAPRAGSVSQLAKCRDWNGGTVEEKKATVIDIRQQLTGGGVEGGTPSISDQDAYDTFERTCSNDFTDAFTLYKIYFRAAAFSNFDPEEYVKQFEE